MMAITTLPTHDPMLRPLKFFAILFDPLFLNKASIFPCPNFFGTFFFRQISLVIWWNKSTNCALSAAYFKNSGGTSQLALFVFNFCKNWWTSISVGGLLSIFTFLVISWRIWVNLGLFWSSGGVWMSMWVLKILFKVSFCDCGWWVFYFSLKHKVVRLIVFA